MPTFHKRRACQNTHRLSQSTFLAMLTEGSRTKEMFDGMTTDEWEIVSFDPTTREVCVRLLNDSGNIQISIGLQNIASFNDSNSSF